VPSVAVLGASGYTGALAASLLWRHPDVDLVALTARSDVGRRLDDLYPRHRVPLELGPYEPGRLEGIDAAIVAYPHGAAAPVVEELRSLGVAVVDLSADFRLRDLGTYEAYYGEHGAPARLREAAYGLPELHREAIRAAPLVANPGCFPTAALLALAPVARAGLLADAVVDVKTGVSGAGRAATETTHFVSVDENVTAYAVGTHRHAPEIDQGLEGLGAGGVRVTVVPHLVPLDQGELTTCYVRTREPVGAERVAQLFADAYSAEPFVELADRPPGVRDVRDTNLCRISTHVDPRSRMVIVLAALDNLWKGASSQAVQNLNLMLGLDETAGLAP